MPNSGGGSLRVFIALFLSSRRGVDASRGGRFAAMKPTRILGPGNRTEAGNVVSAR
jgi:hypothetical protein